MTPALTLVTGFWDPQTLGRDPALRPATAYLDLFARLHRTVPWPMVVWVDPAWESPVREVTAAGAPAERRIHVRSFDDLPRAPERRELAALRPFDNHDPRKDTLGFSILTWAKPSLVVDAIAIGPADSRRWAWIDFGIAHVADLEGVDWDAIARAAPERVRLCTMRATAAAELEDPAGFYRANRGRVAAGFFTGDARSMRELRSRVDGEVARMRATGRRGHDEQILAALAGREPSAFERWYADYAGIVANYVAIRRDVPTVLRCLSDCRARGLWDVGTDVARSVLAAVRQELVSLSSEEGALLLAEAVVCAYREDRPLATSLAGLLASLHRHGNDAFRAALTPWRSVLGSNLAFVGVDLERPPWTRDDLLKSSELGGWRRCL